MGDTPVVASPSTNALPTLYKGQPTQNRWSVTSTMPVEDHDLNLFQVLRERGEEDTNIAFKVLDGLAIGQQMLAGLAREVADRAEGRSPDSIWNEMLSGARRKASFREVTEDNLLGWMVGTGADMVADPINLLGVPVVAKAWGKGVRGIADVGMQAVKKAPYGQRMVDRIGTKLMQETYLLDRYGLGGLLNLRKELREEMNWLRHTVLEEGTDSQKEVFRLVPDPHRREVLLHTYNAEPAHQFVDDAGKLHEWFDGAPNTLRENPRYTRWREMYGDLGVDEASAYDVMKKRLSQIEADKGDYDILSSEKMLDFNKRTDMANYHGYHQTREWSLPQVQQFVGSRVTTLERMLVAETDEVVRARIVKELENASRWSEELELIKKSGMWSDGQRTRWVERLAVEPPRPGMTQFRKNSEMLVDWDEALRDGLETDALLVMRADELAVGRARIAGQAVKKMGDYLETQGVVLGKEFAKLPKDEIIRELARRGKELDPRLLDAKLVESRVLRGKVVPDFVEKELLGASRLYENPGEVASIWRKITQRYKALTLAIYPSYWARNFVGNLSNNFMAGMGLDAMQDYHAGANFMAAVKSGTLDDTIKLGLPNFNGTQKELHEIFVRKGIIGGGQFSEVGMVLSAYDDAGIVAKVVDPLHNPVFKQGFRIGQSIEDHARSSHMIWALRNGKTVDAAEASVNKFLFDYRHGLTDFEGKWGRDRVMPFYAWTRFNLPLQLEMLVLKPQKMAFVGKAINVFDAEDGLLEELGLVDGGDAPDETFMDEWLKQGAPLRWKYNKETDTHDYMMFDNWLPMMDIALARPKSLGREAMNLISPVLKAPLEVAVNYNLFRGEKIERYPGEEKGLKSPLGELMLPARLEHLARTLRPINDGDRVMRSYEGGGYSSAFWRVMSSKLYPQDYNAQRNRWDKATKAQIKDLLGLRFAEMKAEHWDNVAEIDQTLDGINRMREEHLKLPFVDAFSAVDVKASTNAGVQNDAGVVGN